MNKFFTLIMIGLFAVVVSGCATIVHGTSTKITVNTQPPGASAKAGNQSIITPGELTLKNNEPQRIEITKDGYKSSMVYVEQQMSGWVWGNIFIGGIIGLGIDYMSGGAYRLEPKDVNVTLEPAN